MEYENPYDDGRIGSKQESSFVDYDATITQTHAFGHDIDHLSNYELARGLKSRHIQFLALGGAIGTGLFVGSGAILSLVGPAPLFMAYLSMMFVVWIVMNDLAEMFCYLPLKGASIPYFVSRFVEPSLAFADGWNYWYAYAILVAAESTAGAIVLQYWTTAVPVGVWIAIILVVILLLNIIAVAFFGEAEFWFASIKFITIIGLIIVSIVIFFGGAPDEDRLGSFPRDKLSLRRILSVLDVDKLFANLKIGFRYWKNENGWGAFNPYLVSGSTGRFLAYWTAFVKAGFAFITSPELIALASGETMAPRRNIPKAARRYVWRLAIFYGLGSLAIGVIVPRNNNRLLSPHSNAAASPFVIGIQLAGIHVLNHVINAAILTSAWSAGNAFVYSGSRVLYSLALNGQAPWFFKYTTKRGVPWAAVVFTWAFGCLAFLNISNSGQAVFQWFSNISTISGFIAWIIIFITYLRFRKAMIWNNMLDQLPYRTPLQPYATYFMLLIIVILTLTNGFQCFFPSEWSVSDFLAAYITFPIFVALYLGHKIWFTTMAALKGDGAQEPSSFMKRWFKSIIWATRTSEIDVLTGKREMDELEALDDPPVARNWLEKFWFWLA